ncbi:MAG: LPS-assembly protein LptD [Gammaproteobacteria bacterium]|nr:MAG: LPS-assembly protein LptD [Gammaproteobacteria bacterium]
MSLKKTSYAPPGSAQIVGLLLILSMVTMAYGSDKTACVATSTAVPAQQNLPITIQAQKAEIQGRNEVTFSDKVELKQGNTKVNADRLHYNKEKEQLTAEGHVSLLTEEGHRFNTDVLSYNLKQHSGNTGFSDYALTGLGHGDAQAITIKNKNLLLLKDVRYTTCPEGRDDWYLSVNRLELDKVQDIGIARHAVMRFYHVPLFYWPYLDFPLSGQRKSGFMAPEIGGSGKLGTTLAVPYYFNIAPQMDDTLTPRLLSKRGLQLENELRFLGKHFSGKFAGAYLPNDREYDADRGSASLKTQHRLGEAWSANIDLNWASDRDYMDDFGNYLDVTSKTHLLKKIEARYRADNWRFIGQALGYQTLDDQLPATQKPYAMLPQLRVYTAPRIKPNQFNFNGDAEVTNFVRENSITGYRFRVQPDVSLPFTRSWGFLVPRLGARYWAYNLESTPEEQRSVGFEAQQDTTVGFASLDTGIYFDRETRWFHRPYTQTLEPRLFYLYASRQDQDNLPGFDTSLPDFTFASLFRENRFVGGDRFGDANQLTAALTTRILDGSSGSERMRLSIGEIFYFADREVNLPAGTISQTRSDYIAELGMNLRLNWYARASLQWDTDEDVVRKSSAYLQYQPRADTIFNAGYRLIKDNQEQWDVSLQWPAWTHWTAMARWNYSAKEQQNLESYAGLEFRQACCWALRGFVNRRLSSNGDQIDTFMLQLELSRLAEVGSRPKNPLEQGLFFTQN